MDRYQKLLELLPVLYPSFRTRSDPSGAEFVLLDVPGAGTGPLSQVVEDRTQYEGLVNHFHLFSGFLRPGQRANALTFSLAVARNLRQGLEHAFPEKRFAVYLTVNTQDVILRFHQLWPGEAPYYEVPGEVARDADADHTDIYAFYPGVNGTE